jgi:hypothetical protein
VAFLVSGCGVAQTGNSSGNACQDITVSYTGNGTTPATRARALALRVTTTGGNIVSVRAHPAIGGTGYIIYPGSVKVNPENGIVRARGTPVERAYLDITGEKILPGSHEIVIVMCSLGSDDANAPPVSGDLFTMTVDGRCDIAIVPEIADRGGIVGEDGQTMPVDALRMTGSSALSTAIAEEPGAKGFQIMCSGWLDSTLCRESRASMSEYVERPASEIRLTPAQRHIVFNWLSKSSLADYTGDTVCNLRDWAWTCDPNFLKTGVIWGKTESILIKNLWTYIREADYCEQHMVSGSQSYNELIRVKSAWVKSYNDRTRPPR